MKTAIDLVERGIVPDAIVRHGIRRLLKQRLAEQRERFAVGDDVALDAWVREMRRSPVALVPDLANAQHYEVPPGFFECVLGPALKYSGCLFADRRTTLGEAEEAMLALYGERAELADGQDLLELGCGWGSFTLWAAKRFPGSRILAVSNSADQRRYVLARARERGLRNVEVVTCDMNAFDTERRFDRVVSVEMFEHMRNWEELLGRVRGWVRDDARVFLHVFTHSRFAYPFETEDESDWMARHFFTGGMMPSDDLIRRLRIPFEVERHDVVDGTHYARTAEAWLQNADDNRAVATAVLARTHGADGNGARTAFQRWRVFFMACAELFGYRGGREWQVSHYRLRPEVSP